MEISNVSVKDLHIRLGFSNPLDYPESSMSKPLTEWKMELDDAPIFRYLYRNFSPHRHLEFGTWQGTGVLYCLEECEATVWTINLLHGEHSDDDSLSYGHDLATLLNDSMFQGSTKLVQPSNFGKISSPSRSWARSLVSQIKRWLVRKVVSPLPDWAKQKAERMWYRTDSLGFIGRYYLEAGLGQKVCQIYCNSLDWDISNYPQGFYDTVLIDGGHSEEVVASDTKKALQLLRSGGIVMWHDFCPKPDVQELCPTPRSVMKAIEDNWECISDQMQDIFWIEPSWILLGIKR